MWRSNDLEDAGTGNDADSPDSVWEPKGAHRMGRRCGEQGRRVAHGVGLVGVHRRHGTTGWIDADVGGMGTSSELLLQGRLEVDLGQHSETLTAQGLADRSDSL